MLFRSTLTDVSLASSGGKSYSQLANQIKDVKKALTDATKTVSDVVDRYNNGVANTGAKGALTTGVTKAQKDYDTAYTALYGAAKSNFNANNAAKSSLLGVYNAANTALKAAQDKLAANKDTKQTKTLTAAVTKAQAAADKAKTAYDEGTATLTKADTGRKDATDALNTAKTDLDKAKNDLGDTFYSSIDAVKTNVLDPYNAFITNTPIPSKVTQTDDEKIAAALDFYKQNGYIDPTWASNNPTLVSQVKTETNAYDQKKAQDAYAAKYSTATDLAGALKDYAEKGLSVDKSKNPDLYNQVMQSITKGIDTPAKLKDYLDKQSAGTAGTAGTEIGRAHV